MQGLMMERPLLISGLLEYAAAVHGDRELVSYPPEEPACRGCYRTAAERARQLANVLQTLGIGPGDRVATLACSTHRHLEVFYAAAGIGAVCHTVNPRLHPEQIAWILNHAGDVALFVDLAFLPQAEAALGGADRVRHVVMMADRAHMPEACRGRLVARLCYEELLATGGDRFDWPHFDENTAGRALLHLGNDRRSQGCAVQSSFADPARLRRRPARCRRALRSGQRPAGRADVSRQRLGHPLCRGADRAHGWCSLARACTALPWPKLIEAEGVTIALGVPTLWVGLIRYLRATGRRLSTLKRVIVGGAACPRTMIEAFQDEFGIEVRHAWGMTEMSPLGTIATLKAKHQTLPPDERARLQAKQGRPVFGVEIKVVDEAGRDLPHDGRSVGEIKVRGPWVCSGYYRSEDLASSDPEGWFATGDVGSIDADGYLQITDRQKDLIKCAGEWISSLEIESLATEHPAVVQAAVIGVPDEKWGERPVLIVVLQPGSNVSESDVLALYDARVAKWCVPVRVVFVDSLPMSATGKVQKNTLREMYADLPRGPLPSASR